MYTNTYLCMSICMYEYEYPLSYVHTTAICSVFAHHVCAEWLNFIPTPSSPFRNEFFGYPQSRMIEKLERLRDKNQHDVASTDASVHLCSIDTSRRRIQWICPSTRDLHKKSPKIFIISGPKTLVGWKKKECPFLSRSRSVACAS